MSYVGIIGTRSGIIISYNTVFCPRRLRTQLARSRNLRCSSLEGESQYIMAERAGFSRRTAAAPVYGGGGLAVCSTREITEWCVRGNLAGAELGDRLTLDRGRVDESGKRESKGRRSQEDHDRRGENDDVLTRRKGKPWLLKDAWTHVVQLRVLCRSPFGERCSFLVFRGLGGAVLYRMRPPTTEDNNTF